MSNLAIVSTEELVAELNKRQVLRCSCGKWPTYMGNWDQDGFALRCRGCLKIPAKCTC